MPQEEQERGCDTAAHFFTRANEDVTEEMRLPHSDYAVSVTCTVTLQIWNQHFYQDTYP